MNKKKKNFYQTWTWYSITGHSSFGLGPNCFLTEQYLMAMLTAKQAFIEQIPVIVTLPADNAPKDAPVGKKKKKCFVNNTRSLIIKSYSSY